jgi:hypothetical protein
MKEFQDNQDGKVKIIYISMGDQNIILLNRSIDSRRKNK